MSFWTDASPLVKAAIVLGVAGLLYLGLAAAAGLPPYAGPETVQQRGIR